MTSKPTEPSAAAPTRTGLIPPRTLAFIQLVGAATSFGLTFSFNRYVASEGIPFVAYVFWQTVSGAVVLLRLFVPSTTRSLPYQDVEDR